MLKHILLGIVIVVGYLFWTEREIVHGPGEIAPETPDITNPSWQKPFIFKGFNIEPKKVFEGNVRVLAKRKYLFLDELKSVSPIDIYAGWGKLSDERNLKKLHFSIWERQPNIKYSDIELSPHFIDSQTDLFHILPANTKIKEMTFKIRKGDIVYLKGFLTDIVTPTGKKLHTSVEIDDGSIENKKILWVEELIIK